MVLLWYVLSIRKIRYIKCIAISSYISLHISFYSYVEFNVLPDYSYWVRVLDDIKNSLT